MEATRGVGLASQLVGQVVSFLALDTSIGTFSLAVVGLRPFNAVAIFISVSAFAVTTYSTRVILSAVRNLWKASTLTQEGALPADLTLVTLLLNTSPNCVSDTIGV